MAKSSIEWTESTWNPVTGCNKISAGCKNCYAERMAGRLKLMGQSNYRNGFQLTLQPQNLRTPLSWKKPQVVFVNSMSDLFHRDIPFSYVKQVFETMCEASWHTFQILTKRADYLEEVSSQLEWAPNIWMGVSVESEKHVDRIEHLRRTGAKTKFLSCEPLLGTLGEVNLHGIHWAIAGGESGPSAREMDPNWAREIREQCRVHGTAFFMKQMGGTRNKGNELDAIPHDLRIRQYPTSLAASSQ